jgi:hypothetical protein
VPGAGIYHRLFSPLPLFPLQGTLNFDGVGLLGSVLQHFCQAEQPPRVLACTHFNELYDERFLPRCVPEGLQQAGLDWKCLQAKTLLGWSCQQPVPPQLLLEPSVACPSALLPGCRTPQLQFHTMEVVASEEGGGGGQPQAQVFLYKLAPGHSGPSFGVSCARLCGVPAQVPGSRPRSRASRQPPQLH